MPSDWRLVASRPLLAEYERKLREAGPRLDPTLRDADIDAVRRQITAVCSDFTDDFDPELIPAHTPDRKDDPVVHTALLADATWLIADDTKHICTQPDGITEYRLPGSDRRVSAMTFSRLSRPPLRHRPRPPRVEPARSRIPSAPPRLTIPGKGLGISRAAGTTTSISPTWTAALSRWQAGKPLNRHRRIAPGLVRMKGFLVL